MALRKETGFLTLFQLPHSLFPIPHSLILPPSSGTPQPGVSLTGWLIPALADNGCERDRDRPAFDGVRQSCSEHGLDWEDR